MHVSDNSTLTLAKDSRFYLLKEGMLVVDEGSTLIIQDNVTIYGDKNNNSIMVNGNIQIGENVTFSRKGDTGIFDGLYILNDNSESILEEVSFKHSGLRNWGASLTISNCTFDNGFLFSHNGNVNVNNSDFFDTWLLLENRTSNQNLIANVNECSFINHNISKGIDIWSYDNFFVEYNEINTAGNGIAIQYSGHGAPGNQQIIGNTITGCNSAGILAYASNALITGNSIYENNIGIKLMNSSNTAIMGNQNAQYNSETQLIRFNTSYELYASVGSFPWQLRYNVIWDEYDPYLAYNWLIYYDIPYGYRHDMLDIRYNCLGENFNASVNLYPHTYYYYEPQWCPPGGELKSGDPIEDLYMGALDQMENGNYVEARNQFQQLIELYPTSSFAISAMKELFRIEKFALNDFAGLKQYFRTNDSIIADTMLMHLGDKLANKCDVELENWIIAINWYEDMITNPLSFQDSIFAIIDLGYVYMLMDNQEKSSYAGRLKEFIPETKEIYFEHKNYLLSLLPGERHKEKSPEVSYKSDQGRLLQNVPNPFSETTQIGYILENEALVSIIITDLTGKVVKQYNEGHQSKGAHKIDVIKKDLAPGTYFYILKLNGKPSDTRKMVVM